MWLQVSALIHTANRDYKSLIEDLIALEVLPPDTDRGQVCIGVAPEYGGVVRIDVTCCENGDTAVDVV